MCIFIFMFHVNFSFFFFLLNLLVYITYIWNRDCDKGAMKMTNRTNDWCRKFFICIACLTFFFSTFSLFNSLVLVYTFYANILLAHDVNMSNVNVEIYSSSRTYNHMYVITQCGRKKKKKFFFFFTISGEEK